MAEQKLHQTRVTIVTPYTNFLEQRADIVNLPSQDGSVGIMSGHMPLVIALFPGICSIKLGDEVKHCVITEGYAEISQHMVLIVTNAAEWPEEIDVRRAYKTVLENQDRVNDFAPGDIRAKAYKERVDRAKARLHLIELYGSPQQQSILQFLKKGES